MLNNIHWRFARVGEDDTYWYFHAHTPGNYGPPDVCVRLFDDLDRTVLTYERFAGAVDASDVACQKQVEIPVMFEYGVRSTGSPMLVAAENTLKELVLNREVEYFTCW
jgi:hypothetical protein